MRQPTNIASEVGGGDAVQTGLCLVSNLWGFFMGVAMPDEKAVKCCTKCGRELPLSKFSYRQKRKRYTSACKKCEHKRAQKYHEEHYEKEQERCRKWRQEHREQRLAYARKYRKLHSEQERERRQKWRKEHHEECRFYGQKWYEEHREEVKTYTRKYYQEHHEQSIAATRNWQKRHLGQYQDYKRGYFRSKSGKASRARTEAKRRAANTIAATLTAEEWGAIIRASKGYCYWCHEKFKRSGPKKMTRDHVIPLSKGGHHTKENVVAACQECNNHKYNHLWSLV